MAEGEPHYTPEEEAEAWKFNEMVDSHDIWKSEVKKIPKETTPDDVINEKKAESERIATEKLKVLMDPELQDFGVRLVNLQEYRSLIARWIAMGRSSQVYMFGWKAGEINPERPSFTDWLKGSVDTGWSSIAEGQTDWGTSVFNLEDSTRLLNILKELHETAKGEGRDEVINRFREQIIKYISEKRDSYGLSSPVREMQKLTTIYSDESSPFRHIWNPANNEWELTSQEEADKIFELFYKSIEPKWKIDYSSSYADPNKLAELQKIFTVNGKEARFDLKDYQYFQRLKSNRHIQSYIKGFLEFLWGDNSPSSVRSTINTLSYAQPHDTVTPGWNRQYHIALIFSNTALRDNLHEKDKHWGTVNMEKPEGFLGAVAMMPNRELWQEMAEMASQAAEWAHPVFDCKGRVVFPKTTEQEPVTED